MCSNIKMISEARFRARTCSIHPNAYKEIIETKWYADENEQVIAALVYDTIDNEWGYVIMGRDEHYVFRCIASQLFLKNEEEAKKKLMYTLHDLPFKESKTLSKKDVFELMVNEDKINRNFKTLRDEHGYLCAKQIIREIGYSFTNYDGRFIKDFQTSGFDMRLWELYLYAYLHEEHFTINKNLPAPDFCCKKNSTTVFIEATTTNLSPSDNGDTEKCFFDNDYLAIKLANSLIGKLRKRYDEEKHVAGNPLIFAIQPYLNLNNITAITRYLYGTEHKYTINNDGMLIIIPQSIEAHIHCSTQRESGFFFRQSSRNISAIIFGNCGTLGKFNRMGMLAGFGDEDISMHICGTYFNFDPNVTWPVLRIAEVKPDSYNETWGQGLSMYHNPNATYPVNANLFQNIRHHFYENGLIKSQICPGCDLISSKTITTIINHR